MIDFGVGWRAVPGMFSQSDGDLLQIAVGLSPPGTAVVETGAWCGRSLAAACEVLPEGVDAWSIDNYLEDSQAAEASPIPATVAKNLRGIVEMHYRALGRSVICLAQDATSAGSTYSGKPISVLLIDDHHSAEKMEANLKAWLPHMANRAVVLLHDYLHPAYGMVSVCQRMLPPAGFTYRGNCSGLGIWDGNHP